jgi:glycosyltransferase involved in cell wall biosynthesis
VRQRQTGLLVPPRDPAALADAVVELLLDAGLRAHMSDQIQRLEETEQGWGPIGCQLRKLYARVAGRQAGCVP